MDLSVETLNKIIEESSGEANTPIEMLGFIVLKAYLYGANDALDKVHAEIKEWYWQADKQALAKDPCVVDGMIDLFIRTINKYKKEGEMQDERNRISD